MPETDSIPAASTPEKTRSGLESERVFVSREHRSEHRTTTIDPFGWFLPTIALIVVMLLALAAETADAATLPKRGTVAYCTATARDLAKRQCIIRVVFAPVGQSHKAVRVAMCESRANPRALSRGGHYYGMFQFGRPERRAYNYGHTPESQARAALRMYRARGWQPWPVCGRR